MRKLHGVHVPHYKNTADCPPVRLPVPKELNIPVSMHIGAPAKPVVKVGDSVAVGQLIAQEGGFVSAPIYAGVSGKVKKIDDMLVSSGQYVQTITIESDGLQTVLPGLTPPAVTDTASFLAAVRSSGVVGLGGAGFPTAVKLAVKDLSLIQAVIINGAECEPYITSDTRTMLDDALWMRRGIELLQKYLQVKRVIIGIEDNKPQCIASMQKACGDLAGVEVHKLPAMYPQGGEKVLIYHTTGRVVPEGKLPIDAGAIVLNCTTLAALAKYMETGMPLTEKCVTVDGSAVAQPKNVIAPIGTPVAELFAFCGGFKEEPKKVLYGGPMMGIAVPDLQAPVLKNTNAVLAFAEKDAQLPKETACIRCGRCINHCPLGLMPQEIETAYRLNKPEELIALKVNLCMECGCCSFGCPAKRPLVQVNKLAKIMVREYQAKQKQQAMQEQAKAQAKKEKAAMEENGGK